MTTGMAHQHGLRRSGPEVRTEPWISDRDAGTTQLLRDEYGVLSSLRCLDVGLAADPGFQGAYPAETSALAALDDPRVAPPERYVVGATGRIIAVVRRHVDGTPLSVLLGQRTRGFDWQTAAVVVTDVLAALSALHGRGVPHRSVHPSQVLVGTNGVCVLVDVGLARRTGGDDGTSNTAGAEAGAGVERRETAIAADLSAVAVLFAACVGQIDSGTGANAGSPAADGVPDLLRAVLERANDPDARDGRTAADLLTAFGKVTARAFDAGWVERGRERLAALVADNRQAPAGLTEMLRAGWSRRRAPGRKAGRTEEPAEHPSPSTPQTGLRTAVVAALPVGLQARLRRPGALWRAGILLLMVAGVIAATVSGLSTKGVKHPSASAAGRASAHPSAIGTAAAAPVPSPSLSPSSSPSHAAGSVPSTGPSNGASAGTGPTTAPGAWQTVGYTNRGALTRDPAVSRSGDGSLRLAAPAGGHVFAGLATLMAAQPGTRTYAAWVRTEGPAQQKVCIDILFYDSTGRQIGSDHAAFTNGGSHDWQAVSVTLARPYGATRTDFQLRLGDQGLSQGGSAWFDDVTVAGP
ncbi:MULTISPECIES: protein kinase [Streptacidiphilus]|uniref:Protein kinase n=1 Tax=Streptacidiphilus cavernicola TaxID=3342716 RepID=A0ABV6UNI2_9ACTN|nr:protein kinase [Streptacidiphilus jeojiense]